MKIYNKLLEYCILPLGDFVLQAPLMKELRQWRRIQYMNRQELQEYQQKNLHKLLKHAVEKNEYYKSLSIENSSDSSVFLNRFPLLNKELIRKNIDKMISGPKKNLVKEVSSGSSGIQGTVYMSKKEEAVIRAIQLLWWEWAGYKIGNRTLQTGITIERNLIKKIKDLLFRVKYFHAFDLSEERVYHFFKGIRSTNWHICGYASSLYVIARIIKEQKLSVPQVQSIISLGDKLFDPYRKMIEEVFKCRVQDTYGCSEGLMIAAQCEAGNYHIMSPHVYLEILDDQDKEVKENEMGRVVVTRLDAFTMPLIRYELGDLAIKAKQDTCCACGRSLPFLGKIIGRNTDIIKTRSGKNLIVFFFIGIFEHYQQIKQFKVIQENMDHIIIEYIPDSDCTDAIIEEIRNKILLHSDNELNITFRKTTFIAPTASGKPQIIDTKIQNIP
jgi:phenylacetate-CoA ligase